MLATQTGIGAAHHRAPEDPVPALVVWVDIFSAAFLSQYKQQHLEDRTRVLDECC
jgi:hypothetical protein